MYFVSSSSKFVHALLLVPRINLSLVKKRNISYHLRALTKSFDSINTFQPTLLSPPPFLDSERQINLNNRIWKHLSWPLNNFLFIYIIYTSLSCEATWWSHFARSFIFEFLILRILLIFGDILSIFKHFFCLLMGQFHFLF